VVSQRQFAAGRGFFGGLEIDDYAAWKNQVKKIGYPARIIILWGVV
jgi:hypothetical protein